MPDVIVRLDIVHEAHFRKPAFELLREVPKVIENFYDALSPRSPIGMEHITSASTNTLSDVLVRLGLFNDVAAVEIRPTRMSIRLPNVSNPESVNIAMDAIRSGHAALGRGPPNVEVASTAFLGQAWIAMEGGIEAAQKLLARNSIPARPIEAGNWGANTVQYNLRCTSSNQEQGWTITIFAEASLIPGSHLFLSTEIALDGNHARSIDDQIKLVEEKFPQVLTGLGLSISSE